LPEAWSHSPTRRLARAAHPVGCYADRGLSIAAEADDGCSFRGRSEAPRLRTEGVDLRFGIGLSFQGARWFT